MVSRRVVLGFGAAGLATLGTTLAGCSTAAKPSTSGSAGAAAATTLPFWIWPDGLSDKVLDKVNAQFPSSPIKVSVIGGDYKQKLVTTFTGRRDIPQITGVKGEDMPYFLSQPDLFENLYDHGASDVESAYLPWKWKSAQTPDGKQLGLPIDIGPTALFYRHDVFEKAGLPSTPSDLASRVADWDSFFELGVELTKALPDHFLLSGSDVVFGLAVGQGEKQWTDAAGKFIGAEGQLKAAWDLAVKAKTLGILAKIANGSPDWAAGISKGTLSTVPAASWAAADIKGAAAKTSGLWSVANSPGGPANIGGSFLTVPKGSESADAAFEVMKWITNAENQAVGYADKGLFPSLPAAYELPELTDGDPFFDGQKTIEIFAPAAQNIPIAIQGPNDSALSAPFYAELAEVESKDKDPEAAFADALSAAQKIASQLGIA